MQKETFLPPERNRCPLEERPDDRDPADVLLVESIPRQEAPSLFEIDLSEGYPVSHHTIGKRKRRGLVDETSSVDLAEARTHSGH